VNHTILANGGRALQDAAQQDKIAKDVAKIRTDVDLILHGNGRRGIWQISDVLFGPAGQPHRGMQQRLEKVERYQNEGRVLQRGIAIGVALVALDIVFGLDLTRVIGGIFGAQ
jgi:hypothetical protein